MVRTSTHAIRLTEERRHTVAHWDEARLNRINSASRYLRLVIANASIATVIFSDTYALKGPDWRRKGQRGEGRKRDWRRVHGRKDTVSCIQREKANTRINNGITNESGSLYITATQHAHVCLYLYLFCQPVQFLLDISLHFFFFQNLEKKKTERGSE